MNGTFSFKPEVIWKNRRVRIVQISQPLPSSEPQNFLAVEVKDGFDSLGAERWVDSKFSITVVPKEELLLELAAGLFHAQRKFTQIANDTFAEVKSEF